MQNQQPTLFFILGRPRSGTTLLRTLLDGHPGIKVPPEYPVVLSLYNRFGKVKHWDPATLAAFYYAFREPLPSENWQYRFLQMNERELFRELKQMPAQVTFQKVFLTFYKHYTSIFPGKDSLLAIGDKNPIFATYADRLKKIFPDARFLFITRDYRDNYLSISRFRFEAPIIALQCYRWKYVSGIIHRFLKKFPDQSMHISHEELIEDPEKMMKDVCEFLGVPFDPVMFDYPKHVEKFKAIVDPDLLASFHDGLSAGINKSSSGQWKTRLSAREIKTADCVAGWRAEEMGYNRTTREFHLSIWLQTLPWQVYGYLLYKVMNIAEHLPPALRKRFAKALPMLAKVWHGVKGRKSEIPG